MNFALIWLDAAEAEFFRSYLVAREAGHADDYTRAAARLELLLEANPTEAGESRSGHGRILVEPPLTVEFEVFAERRVAVITRARYTPAR